jgi:hypothetical protein
MNLLARLIERFRPTQPSEWSTSAWGDVPALPSDLRNLKSSLCHFGTSSRKGRHDHV